PAVQFADHRMHWDRVKPGWPLENEGAVKRLHAWLGALSLVGGVLLVAGPAQSQSGPDFQKKKDGPPFKKGFDPPFGKDGPPGFKKRGPKVGDQAPVFELKFLDSRETFKLQENIGKRPTVLIFHNFT